MIGAKTFDADSMLYLSPICEHFVSLQGLILRAQKAGSRIMCMIIHECDVIFGGLQWLLLVQAPIDQCESLLQKCRQGVPHAPFDWLASCLSIFTRRTCKLGSFIDELNPSDHIVLD